MAWHPKGLMFGWGVLDFAGGTVVHISAGMAALAGAIVLKARKSTTAAAPANIPYVLIGTGLLWFGWFGFNAGSAVGASSLGVYAFATTNTAAAAAGLAWMFLDVMRGKKPSVLGFCIGAVVSATADLGFGRRAAEFSYNDGGSPATLSLASVKQLYVSYAASDKVKLTLGKWATHVGYELVDAVGIKADIGLGGKSALMVGFANPTDQSTTVSSTKMLIAQFSTATKDDKLKAYLNYQGGSSPSTKINQVDLVLMGALSSKFSINYNGSLYSLKAGGTTTSWFGSALYFNYDPTDKFGLTVRGEYFGDKKAVTVVGTDVIAFTVSGNIKLGPLTVIPELRFDNGKLPIFEKNNGAATKSAASAILAAVYKF
ncbi:unnamed protein product [Rotaria sordida]|uniref:Ammonium transporter AmtB-like domain-containing protein n=1 Tax=Rotaria sordida TaxID=392033 RepID=A0A813YA70_9BILA|nr:unnamed protein product [Rotaria sordida]